jgi:hypothetical protein
MRASPLLLRGTVSWYTNGNCEQATCPARKRKDVNEPMKQKPLIVISVFLFLLIAGIYSYPHYFSLFTDNWNDIGFDYFLCYASLKALDAGIADIYYSPEMKDFYEALSGRRWIFVKGSGDSHLLPYYFLFIPFSFFPFKTSAIIFILFSLMSFIFSIYLLSMLLIRDRTMAILVPSLITLYIPVCCTCIDNILVGQMGFLLALFLILCYYYSEKGKPWLSGFFLALAVLLKSHPLMMLFYFLGRRDFKTVISCVATLAISCVAAGFHWGFYRYAQLQDNLNYLLQTVYYAGYTRDPAKHFQADSLIGMINAASGYTLSLDQLKTINLIIIVIFAAYIVRISISRRLRGEYAGITAYSICLISSMICAPFTWPQHHITMFIPFIAFLALFLHEDYGGKIGGALYPILLLYALYFIMDGEGRTRVWLMNLHALYDKAGMGLYMLFIFLVVMLYLLVSAGGSETPAEHKAQ